MSPLNAKMFHYSLPAENKHNLNETQHRLLFAVFPCATMWCCAVMWEVNKAARQASDAVEVCMLAFNR